MTRDQIDEFIKNQNMDLIRDHNKNPIRDPKNNRLTDQKCKEQGYTAAATTSTLLSIVY